MSGEKLTISEDGLVTEIEFDDCDFGGGYTYHPSPYVLQHQRILQPAIYFQ